jgi:hypothetical protein
MTAAAAFLGRPGGHGAAAGRPSVLELEQGERAFLDDHLEMT